MTNLLEFPLDGMVDFEVQTHHSLHCNYQNELYRVAYVKVDQKMIKANSQMNRDRVKIEIITC